MERLSIQNVHPAASPPRRRKAGFTLIELIVAGAVLVVGVATMSGLVGLAVASYGHSRLDSTAVILAQAVTEQVSSAIADTSFGGSGTASLTDCGSHTTIATAWPIDAAPTPTGQVTLLSSGNIDFSQPKASGYHMDYAVCTGSTVTTYDVRWNITQLSGTSQHSELLTVGVQMEGGGIGPITFPINMKVLVGPDPVPGT